MKRGDARNALADADDAVAASPRWAKGHARRGQALSALGRFKDARVAYAKGLKDEPASSELYQGLEAALAKEGVAGDPKALGDAAFKAGDAGSAAAYYTRAIRTDASNEKLWSNRSAAFATLGNAQRAFSDAQEAVRLKPKWAKAYRRCADALTQMANVENASESPRGTRVACWVLCSFATVYRSSPNEVSPNAAGTGSTRKPRRSTPATRATALRAWSV